jgi:hypothetical protein
MNNLCTDASRDKVAAASVRLSPDLTEMSSGDVASRQVLREKTTPTAGGKGNPPFGNRQNRENGVILLGAVLPNLKDTMSRRETKRDDARH